MSRSVPPSRRVCGLARSAHPACGDTGGQHCGASAPEAGPRPAPPLPAWHGAGALPHERPAGKGTGCGEAAAFARLRGRGFQRKQLTALRPQPGGGGGRGPCSWGDWAGVTRVQRLGGGGQLAPAPAGTGLCKDVGPGQEAWLPHRRLPWPATPRPTRGPGGPGQARTACFHSAGAALVPGEWPGGRRLCPRRAAGPWGSASRPAAGVPPPRPPRTRTLGGTSARSAPAAGPEQAPRWGPGAVPFAADRPPSSRQGHRSPHGPRRSHAGLDVRHRPLRPPRPPRGSPCARRLS